ncbi:MAG: type IV secretion system protein [Sulfurovum sp.]|nr:type IV secretion system protein [Sulfurovum sp.]
MSNKDDIDDNSLGFELEMSELTRKSNNRAWTIAFISMFLFLGVLALYLYKPLVQKIPYVIKIDSNGIPNLLTSLNEKNLEVSEAVDKYFIKEYIVRREQYYWNLLEKDYLFTQLLSSPPISKGYQKIYEGKKGRDSIFKDRYQVHIKIKSITSGHNAGNPNATVRIEKTTKQLSSSHIIKTENLVITLVYTYNTSLKMTEKERLENPLGFRVITYKTDKEFE